MSDGKGQQDLMESALALDGRIETHLKHIFIAADEVWNPLQVIYGILESMDTSNLGDAQTADLEAIKKNTKVLMKRVEDLLKKEEKLKDDFNKLFFVR